MSKRRRQPKIKIKYRKQFGRCLYCNKKMFLFKDRTKNHPKNATIDHLTPQCKEGNEFTQNCFVACYQCNQQKKAMHWRKFVGKYIGYPHIKTVEQRIQQIIAMRH